MKVSRPLILTFIQQKGKEDTTSRTYIICVTLLGVNGISSVMEEPRKEENDWTWALQHCSRVRTFHHAINRTVGTIKSIIAAVIVCEQVPHSFTFREKDEDVLFLAVAGEMGQAALFSMSTR